MKTPVSEVAERLTNSIYVKMAEEHGVIQEIENFAGRIQ
jgi:hypothetical protein